MRGPVRLLSSVSSQILKGPVCLWMQFASLLELRVLRSICREPRRVHTHMPVLPGLGRMDSPCFPSLRLPGCTRFTFSRRSRSFRGMTHLAGSATHRFWRLRDRGSFPLRVAQCPGLELPGPRAHPARSRCPAGLCTPRAGCLLLYTRRSRSGWALMFPGRPMPRGALEPLDCPG